MIGAAPQRSADTVAIAWALRLAAVTGIVLDDPSQARLATVADDSGFDLSSGEHARINALRS